MARARIQSSSLDTTKGARDSAHWATRLRALLYEVLGNTVQTRQNRPRTDHFALAHRTCRFSLLELFSQQRFERGPPKLIGCACTVHQRAFPWLSHSSRALSRFPCRSPSKLCPHCVPVLLEADSPGIRMRDGHTRRLIDDSYPSRNPSP